MSEPSFHGGPLSYTVTAVSGGYRISATYSDPLGHRHSRWEPTLDRALEHLRSMLEVGA